MTTVNLTTAQPEQDDLFARLPRSKMRTAFVQTARITCRVCNARAEQSIHTPALLCPACLVDLDATAAHVATVREQANARLQACLEAWDRTYEAADAATLERFARVQAARDGSEAFRVKYERTLALKDALSVLLLAWERREQEGAEIERLMAWCEAAEREIAAARTE